MVKQNRNNKGTAKQGALATQNRFDMLNDDNMEEYELGHSSNEIGSTSNHEVGPINLEVGSDDNTTGKSTGLNLQAQK